MVDGVTLRGGAPAAETIVADTLPPRAGERLTRTEFERRYSAHPQIKKAELIEGVVYVPSPVRYDGHGLAHAALLGPLHYYAAHTPGVGIADNTTVRLDLDNEVQPDVLLRLEAPAEAQSQVTPDGYLEGAPELVAEIAASSASYDLHAKLHVYRRNGVPEYLVWRIQERRIDWYRLVDGDYRPLPQVDGIIRSRAFPGLRLNVRALLQGAAAAALAAIQSGLDGSEHRTFAARAGGD